MPGGVEGSPTGPPRSPRPALRAGRRRPTSSRRERCPCAAEPDAPHRPFGHSPFPSSATWHQQAAAPAPNRRLNVGPPNPLAQTRAWSRPASAPKKAGWTASTGPQGPPEPLNPTTSHPSILRLATQRRFASSHRGDLPLRALPRSRPISRAVGGHFDTLLSHARSRNWHGRWQRCDCGNGEDWGVAKSYYKAAWIGKLPMCAICGGAGDGPRAEHHLTHGVSVWLCGAHRSDEFQRRRAGRDFVASLQAVWRAAGIRSKRHEAALSAHLDRVRRQPQRAQPGSYSWPSLRREAERRFSAGEQPRRVIEDCAGSTRGSPRTSPRSEPCGGGSVRPDGSRHPCPRPERERRSPRTLPRRWLQGPHGSRSRTLAHSRQESRSGTARAVGHPHASGDVACHGARPRASSSATRRATGRPTTVVKSPSIRATSAPRSPGSRTRRPGPATPPAPGTTRSAPRRTAGTTRRSRRRTRGRPPRSMRQTPWRTVCRLPRQGREHRAGVVAVGRLAEDCARRGPRRCRAQDRPACGTPLRAATSRAFAARMGSRRAQPG